VSTTNTINVNGGMNNVLLPHLLPVNQAAEIRNLYLGKDGVWHDIKESEIMLDLSATFLENAVKVVYWKPTSVPIDCIDDFVYVVFTSDGIAKLVYRGTEGLTEVTLDIKARIFGTTSYRAVLISDVTPDKNGDANGTTSTSPSGSLTRKYWNDTEVTLTAALSSGDDEDFLHWIDGDSGVVLTDDRVLELTLAVSKLVIAEYVGVPYIRVENAAGVTITSLGEFASIEGEYSDSKSYYVGGVGLTNPLLVYAPEEFEIQIDGDATWTPYGEPISISAATANSGMTKINVRYAPVET